MAAEVAAGRGSVRATGLVSTTGRADGQAADRLARRRRHAAGSDPAGQPRYTTEAMLAKIQGRVRLSVVVRADGTVGDVKVDRLARLAVRTGRKSDRGRKVWRFKPGMRQGHPVDVQVTLILDFRLH